MLRKILLSFGASVIALNAMAQLNYSIATDTATYVPLTGGVSVNDTIIWDDRNFAMPIGFNFNMDGQVNDTLYISRDNLLGIDTTGTVNVFVMTDMELADRGTFNDTETRSPMRYQLTGTAPNRIFKFELANAGISTEHVLHGTNNDSVNIQAWFYETSNIVELRYGSSKISHPSDYHFLSAGKALNGFIKNFNLKLLVIQMGYFLDGDPAAPTVDSASDLFSISGGLNNYPPNRTVYRFTPKPANVKDKASLQNKLELLSNTSSQQVLLNNSGTETFRYTIIGLNGATMYNSGVIKQGTNHISIGNLPQGMYLLHVSGNDGRQCFRINKL